MDTGVAMLSFRSETARAGPNHTWEMSSGNSAIFDACSALLVRWLPASVRVWGVSGGLALEMQAARCHGSNATPANEMTLILTSLAGSAR